ncbi:BtaA family protein [Gammaproteobacteria bacterium]|nr:BtaA family protein [Gammaproteobacteria bacterium]
MNFYNRLNYSLGNEDWHVEEQALQVKENDKVICVTASGDRPLHLLLTPCSEVISIDMNKIQNYLLDLKMAALSILDYETYLSFLGCTKTKNRYSIYKTLTPNLSKESINYWQKNISSIKKGIIYQGKVERFTFMTSKIFNLFSKKQIKTIFSFNEIELQRDYILKKLDSPAWKKVFNISCNPKVMKLFINDPGVVSYIEPSIKPGAYIHQRMLEYLSNNLARKSALLQLILLGKVLPEAYFPYLTFDGYTLIRENLHKLKYQTADIIDYINIEDDKKFDCYSMSDIASYMPQNSFNNLLEGIIKSSNNKARFCIRKLMSNHVIPDFIKEYFNRDMILEKKLEKEESNFVYRFLVGEIKHQS